MRNKDRRRKGDRFALLRGAPGAYVPPLVKPRRGNKFADPEDILQAETNEYLARAGQFHFRLSAHVLSKAGDASIGGWPDNPLITRLGPGLALLGPLELKKAGETLRPNQIEMQTHLGTVTAWTFAQVEAYCKWYWAMVGAIRAFLIVNPQPENPLLEKEGNP